MEDIVAARVRDHSSQWYGFMTWARIVDRIDGSWVKEVVLANARKRAIPEVAEREGLFHFANAGIPFGPSYEWWRQDRQNEFEQGTFPVIFSAPSAERRAGSDLLTT